jgi:hypothetical protein
MLAVYGIFNRTHKIQPRARRCDIGWNGLQGSMENPAESQQPRAGGLRGSEERDDLPSVTSMGI